MYIRKWLREKAVLSLEEGIRKATYAPAQRMGLKDRGMIATGAYADIVVFDYETIGERGTWLDPLHGSEGIKHVLVNGQVVHENKEHTGAKPGKVIRHA